MPSNYLPTQGLTFRKLSNEKLGRIHAASLEILERTGSAIARAQRSATFEIKGSDSGKWRPRTYPCQTGGMGPGHCT